MGTISGKDALIEGITDRTRLKLYRDELVRTLERGMLGSWEDGESVTDLSLTERNRLAAEVMRINDYLNSTSYVTPKRRDEKEQTLVMRRLELLQLCSDLSTSFGGDISRSPLYGSYNRELRLVSHELFKLTGKKY